jgi:hypothetical protein
MGLTRKAVASIAGKASWKKRGLTPARKAALKRAQKASAKQAKRRTAHSRQARKEYKSDKAAIKSLMNEGMSATQIRNRLGKERGLDLPVIKDFMNMIKITSK